MPRITYALTEEALADVFGVKDEAARTGAFRGLLQNLRRQGMPGGAEGPGKAFNYTQAEIDVWLIALSLEKVGVAPSYVVEFIKKHEPQLTTIARVARAKPKKKGDDYCILIETDRLSHRWGPRPERDLDITAAFWRIENGMGAVSDFLERDGSGHLLNLTVKLRKLDVALRAACLAPLEEQRVAPVSRAALRRKSDTLKTLGNRSN